MWLTALLSDAVQSKDGLFSKAIVKFIVPLNILDKITVRTKGQIKPKADWRPIDSPKKRTNKNVFLPRQSGNT